MQKNIYYTTICYIFLYKKKIQHSKNIISHIFYKVLVAFIILYQKINLLSLINIFLVNSIVISELY